MDEHVGEEHAARHAIRYERDRLKEIAGELRRRATTSYVKDVAKEKAVEKGHEWKERMLDSPIAIGVVGGLTTAAVASLVQRLAGRGESEFERGYLRGKYAAAGYRSPAGYVRVEGDNRTASNL